MTATPVGGNLDIQKVKKVYGGVTAVDEASLTVQRGEFLTLLGPSGSGKTTLLMMIAGFVQPDSGSIFLNAQPIGHLPPERRNFGMVFQGYALFPHLTVFENVAFPLKVRNRSRHEIEQKVRATLELVQLSSQAERLPRQISGGQQQRVALARAMVFTPHLLLLDEPLSALDKMLRAELQEELKRLHQRVGLTFIYVTHDQDEALSMSDRVAVMRDGKLIQCGSPTELYEEPKTTFVANFLGKSNFLRGRVESHAEGSFVFSTGSARFVQATPNEARPSIGSSVAVALRPEKIAVMAKGDTLDNAVTGTVVEWSYFGSKSRLVIDTPALGQVAVVIPSWSFGNPPSKGQQVTVGWDSRAGMQVAEG